jgi:hypothetical protein
MDLNGYGKNLSRCIHDICPEVPFGRKRGHWKGIAENIITSTTESFIKTKKINRDWN